MRRIAVSPHILIFVGALIAPIVTAVNSRHHQSKPHVHVDVMTVYYMPFDAYTYGAMSVKSLEKSVTPITFSDPHDIDITLQHLANHNVPNTHFSEGVIRLLVQYKGDTIMMDEEGNVQHGKDSYQVPPSTFLELYDYFGREERRRKVNQTW